MQIHKIETDHAKKGFKIEYNGTVKNFLSLWLLLRSSKKQNIPKCFKKSEAVTF